MMSKKVNASKGSIKAFDLVNLAGLPDGGNASELETAGLCLWLQGGGMAMVLAIETYNAICDALGGVA